TQALFLTVFITRYLDLFYKFHSLYNSIMKTRYKATWDPALDTLRVEYLLGPCALLSLILHYSFTFAE
ncbi:endoplasmic reticulum retention protein, partial [Dinochytrium kinnereticum]